MRTYHLAILNRNENKNSTLKYTDEDGEKWWKSLQRNIGYKGINWHKGKIGIKVYDVKKYNDE